jgi:hypothetical protein
MDDVCSQCGHTLSPQPAGSQRMPCPKCGSLARTISLSATIAAGASISATATVVPYPQALLQLAKDLFTAGQYGVAVVVAHIACEVAVQRAFDRAFLARGVQYLQDSVMDFCSGFNLDNRRIRRLYTALTDDDIGAQPFWAAFSASATRRNRMVHEGSVPSAQDAAESLRAVEAFLTHIGN